ncbi:MAG: oligosaccharide flippase family protein [Gammaproteobacteria bacterium]
MPSVRNALFHSFTGRSLVALTEIVSVLVLARLLTPEEIGVFAVATAFAALLHVFREFGVGTWIIQTERLDSARLGGAYGLAMATGVLMAIILLATASPISIWMGDARTGQLIVVAAATFLTVPFGSVGLALLNRAMAFDAILRIHVGAALAQATTAIGLALTGFGPFSLAVGGLVSSLTTIVLARRFAPRDIPFQPGTRHWREIAEFGGLATLRTLLITLGTRSPEVIVGKMIDLSAAGLYSRAAGMASLFNRVVMRAVNAVAHPAFAGQHRAEGDSHSAYLHSTVLVNALSWPFFAFVGFMAEPLVLVLFGDQWKGSVPLVSALCLGAALRSVAVLHSPFLTAIGHIGATVRLQVFIQLARIALIVFGAGISLLAAAWAQAAAFAVTVAAVWFYLIRYQGFRLTGLASSVYLNIGPALAGVAGPLLATSVAASTHALVQLPLAAAVSLIAWLTVLRSTRHPLWPEIERALAKLRRSRE